MRIKIRITKEILKESMYCDKEGLSRNCAIALAVVEIFPGAAVGTWGIYLDNGEISLPENASDFVRKFDDATPSERAKLTPMSFDVEVPDKIINYIGIEEVKSILSNSLTLEKVLA